MKCSLLALSSYLDDELDPGRRAEIEAHLVGCERCQKGLECLREETERFGALGRVHVPDDAVSGFLQQLGLLGPGESLPPRSPRPPDPPGPDLPRWLGGGGAAEPLPWSARHNPEPPPAPPESDQPSLPFLDAFSPSGVTVMAAPLDEPSQSDELHLTGRSVPAAAPARAPEPVAGASEPPAPDAWPHGSIALEGVGAWPTGHAIRVTSSGEEATAFKAVASKAGGIEPGAPTVVPEAVVAPSDIPPPPPPPAASWSPASLVPPAPPAPPPPPAGPLPAPRPLRSEPPSPRPADQMWPISLPPTPYARASDDQGDPWSWAPRDDPAPPQSRIYPAPTFSGDPLPSIPGGGGAPSGPRMDDEVVGGGDPADEDAAADPLIDPLIARVARPPQPVRATLISRLRDQVSLRLALMRSADGDAERAAAAAPGPSHGAQPPESAGLLTAALRYRMDAHAEMDEPAAPPTGEALPAQRASGVEHLAATPWSGGPPFDSAMIAEASTPRVRDLDRGPGKPGRHARQLGDRRWIGPSAGKVAPSSGRFGDLPHRVRHLAGQSRRRYLIFAILAVLAVLVATVSLLVTHGPPTLPLVANTGATSRAAPLPSATPALLPAIGLQPSAPVAPSAAPSVSATPAPTPVPTPVPAPVVATQSFGSGGSGWTAEDVRYGTQPDGDLWIVIDFSGGSGEPRATASFSDPTTLDVTLAGARESGLSPGTGGIVTKAAATSSGSTVNLVFDLSKAVTLKNGSYTPQDSSSPYPLHLILDIG